MIQRNRILADDRVNAAGGYWVIYVLLGVFLAGVGLGSGVTYKIEQASLRSLQADIINSNEQADLLLATVRAQIKTAESNALASNVELDHANAQSIVTINAYHERLAAARLYDAGAQDCPDAVSTSSGSGKPEAKTAGRELSAATANFIRDEAWRADQISSYALSCWRFVTSNCGTIQEQNR